MTLYLPRVAVQVSNISCLMFQFVLLWMEIFSLEGLDKIYDAIVLSKSNIKNDFLRERSFGWGLTKMISFWESPYDKFLVIDGDTNVWGDVRELANFQDYDFLIDKPEYEYSINDLNKWFFDTKEMEIYFPSFNYLNNPYVCPAVLFGTKNVFPIEEYRYILNFVDKHPNIFKFGDMGFLNYLLFKLSKENKIRLGSSDIQYIVCDFDQAETKSKFYFENGKPVLNQLTTVIHWPGDKKPVSANQSGYYPYQEPMRYFRKKFLKDSTSLTDYEIEKTIDSEDKKREFNLKYSKKSFNTFTKIKRIFSILN